MIKQRMERLTDEELEDLICELEAAGFYRRQLIGLTELQERRKADSKSTIASLASQIKTIATENAAMYEASRNCTHELKVDTVHFAAVVDGLKSAELRINDHNYQSGDELVLREFDRDSQKYSGEQCTAYVQHVADVGTLAPGFVLLSIEVL